MIYTVINLTIINTLSINFNTDFIKNSRIKKLLTKLYKKYKKLYQMLLINEQKLAFYKMRRQKFAVSKKKKYNIIILLFWLLALLIQVIFLLFYHLINQNIQDN